MDMTKLSCNSLIKMNLVFSFLILFSAFGCQNSAVDPENDYPDYHKFSSYADFVATIEQIASLEDSTVRENQVNMFWDSHFETLKKVWDKARTKKGVTAELVTGELEVVQEAPNNEKGYWILENGKRILSDAIKRIIPVGSYGY